MSDPETALCDALETAGQEYTQTISEIDSLSAALSGGAGREQAGQRLQQLALRTRETEARVANHLEAWKQLGAAPDERLREVMSRQRAVLSELIQRINEVERSARSARETLLPKVDASMRSSEMRSAYARAVRQASE